jgi:hypothetical protein
LGVLRRYQVYEREALSGASLCFWTQKSRKMARNALKTDKNKVFEQNLAKILAYMQKKM